MVLCASCAMSGTDTVYGLMLLCASYAMSGTDKANAATRRSTSTSVPNLAGDRYPSSSFV
eukprot:3604507-Rhodomonas_salina.1